MLLCNGRLLHQYLSSQWCVLKHQAETCLVYNVGALGEAAEHLEKAAEEDLDNYMQNVAPDGVDEHTAMLAKLRDETKAAEGNLPTEAAATGKWQ